MEGLTDFSARSMVETTSRLNVLTGGRQDLNSHDSESESVEVAFRKRLAEVSEPQVATSRSMQHKVQENLVFTVKQFAGETFKRADWMTDQRDFPVLVHLCLFEADIAAQIDRCWLRVRGPSLEAVLMAAGCPWEECTVGRKSNFAELWELPCDCCGSGFRSVPGLLPWAGEVGTKKWRGRVGSEPLRGSDGQCRATSTGRRVDMLMSARRGEDTSHEFCLEVNPWWEPPEGLSDRQNNIEVAFADLVNGTILEVAGRGLRGVKRSEVDWLSVVPGRDRLWPIPFWPS